MIRVENGKVVAPELSYDGVLSAKILKNYNHIKYKKLFEEVVDTMAMNLIVHTFYQKNLKYSVNEKLEFIVLCQTEDNQKMIQKFLRLIEYIMIIIYMDVKIYYINLELLGIS